MITLCKSKSITDFEPGAQLVVVWEYNNRLWCDTVSYDHDGLISTWTETDECWDNTIECVWERHDIPHHYLGLQSDARQPPRTHQLMKSHYKELS